MLLTEIRTNTIPDIVDFGRFNDISYLNKINLKYNNTNLSDTQIKFANKYISLQLDITLNNTIIKDMRNIISVIPDNYFYTDPWFFPYCVFHYEYSNGLTNYHRLWDITDVTIGDKQKLLEISLQYDANYQEF